MALAETVQTSRQTSPHSDLGTGTLGDQGAGPQFFLPGLPCTVHRDSLSCRNGIESSVLESGITSKCVM